jgi:hypothetical protein
VARSFSTVDGTIHVELGLFEEPGQEGNDGWIMPVLEPNTALSRTETRSLRE